MYDVYMCKVHNGVNANIKMESEMDTKQMTVGAMLERNL